MTAHLTGCDLIAIQVRVLGYIERLPNGCMIWTGGRSYGGAGKEKRGRGGPYGTFWIDRLTGSVRAHIVWAWLTGKIPEPRVPEGHHLDHHCVSGTLCVCCTNLETKQRNIELGRSRKDPAVVAVARARADARRLERLANRREARVTG